MEDQCDPAEINSYDIVAVGSLFDSVDAVLS